MIIINGSEAHLHIHRLEGDKMYIEGDFLTLYVLYMYVHMMYVLG